MNTDSPDRIYEAGELLTLIKGVMADYEIDILLGNKTAKEVAEERGVKEDSIVRSIRRKKDKLKGAKK